MNNNLISVVIPVYNVSPYISKCLDSISLSNNKNWEAIIVDDGSTDNTLSICESYMKTDKRFRVYHKENGGVSSARNYAIKLCRGKWICFIDGDDYIDKYFLDIEGFEECDIVRKSHYIVNEESNNIRQGFKNNRSVLYRKKRSIFKYYINRDNFALWDMIINANIVKRCSFKDSIKIGEDLLFFLSCLEHINTYAISKVGAYYYRIRNGSAMYCASSCRNERIRLCFCNIENVINTTKNYNHYVGEAIVAKNYLMELFNYKYDLSRSESRYFL